MLSTAERTELVDCCELVDVGGGLRHRRDSNGTSARETRLRVREAQGPGPISGSLGARWKMMPMRPPGAGF